MSLFSPDTAQTEAQDLNSPSSVQQMRLILIYLSLCVRGSGLVPHIIKFRPPYHIITYHLNIMHLHRDEQIPSQVGEALKNLK